MDLSPSNQTRSRVRGGLASERGPAHPVLYPAPLLSQAGVKAAPPTLRPRPSREPRVAPRPAGAGRCFLLVSFPEAELSWLGERCAGTSEPLDARGWCVAYARGAEGTGREIGGPALLQGWRERVSVSSGRGAWRPRTGPQALLRGSAAGLACQRLRRDGGGSGTPTVLRLAAPLCLTASLASRTPAQDVRVGGDGGHRSHTPVAV